MTHPEITNNRPSYFSGWCRKNLTDSKNGFLVSDIDFVLYNYKTKNIMLIEEKTGQGEVSYSQRNIINIIHKCLYLSSKSIGINYLGYHLFKYNNGLFYFDKKIISEVELIKKLTF